MITHDSVAPSIFQYQSVLMSYPNAIPKGVLLLVLESLTRRGALPDDTSRWTNQLKRELLSAVIGGKGQEELPLVLTALGCGHFPMPVRESIAFHLKSDHNEVRNHLEAL